MRILTSAILTLGLVVASAIAQTPAPSLPQANAPPTEPNRLQDQGETCIGLVRDLKAPMQASCYVTGTAEKFGRISAKSAVCDNTSYNDSVKQCFGEFAIKSQYIGYEGPVCGAILLDVRRSDMPPPNQWQRRVHSKEVFPCEGRPAPAVSPLDKGDVDEFVRVRYAEQTTRSGCVFKDKKVADVDGVCIMRAAPDASFKLTERTSMTCSDPALSESASSCLKTLRIKPAHRAEHPAEICVRIHHVGKALMPKGKDGYTSVQEMAGCPAGFFQ